jgi:hypothetical protein
MKSGSTYVARVLALYFGAQDTCPTDYHGRREQNLLRHALEPYLDRNLVAQMHVKPYVPNIECIVRYSFSVVYLWRNLGDVIVSFDDHIRNEDYRNPVCYVDDWERYLAMPRQHRYRYLIQHATPWYVSFYLAWRRAAGRVPVIVSHYEDLVSDSFAFFARIIRALKQNVSEERLRSILAAGLPGTRLNVGRVGRSNELLSAENQRFLDHFLLTHLEDLSELWHELPWRGRGDRDSGEGTGRPEAVSVLKEVAACEHNTGAGALLSREPVIRISVVGEGFFFLIPGPLLAPPTGRSVRLRLVVRGQVGSQFSLYWRAQQEVFSEARAKHVPYCPPTTVCTIEFAIPDFPGSAPAFFRLDCFNEVRSSGIGEILEIVRIEA